MSDIKKKTPENVPRPPQFVKYPWLIDKERVADYYPKDPNPHNVREREDWEYGG